MVGSKMILTYDDVCITPQSGNRYRVNKPVTYKDITVPIGYVTNGADIPRIFWMLLPPNRSDYLPAVIVHDYMCDNNMRMKGNQYFEEILAELGVSTFDRLALVNAVNLYTRIKHRDIYLSYTKAL